jgi:serine/threonine protein kinase
MRIITQTHYSTIYYDSETNLVRKTSPKELIANESRVLEELRGLSGIPNIQLDSDSIVMPRYQELPIKNLDLIQIRWYVQQLGTILSQVHQKGFAHLDITPKNILRDKNQIVLIDFALSKRVDELHYCGCGTPGYVAPEVYVNERTTTASDMYSLGIIFGQMMENYLPGVPLNCLGSKMVRHSTTNTICKKLESILFEKDHEWKEIQYHAAHLLLQLLQYEPFHRITAKDLLKHPFIVAPEYQFTEFTYEIVQPKLLQYRMASLKTKRYPISISRG